MRLGTILFVAFLPAFASPCYSADDEKNKKIDELTSIQLGDYSLKFEGENPRKSTALEDPPGLNSFKRDAFNPFLGLKFSAPLKDDLFKFGR